MTNIKKNEDNYSDMYVITPINNQKMILRIQHSSSIFFNLCTLGPLYNFKVISQKIDSTNWTKWIGQYEK